MVKLRCDQASKLAAEHARLVRGLIRLDLLLMHSNAVLHLTHALQLRRQPSAAQQASWAVCAAELQRQQEDAIAAASRSGSSACGDAAGDADTHQQHQRQHQQHAQSPRTLSMQLNWDPDAAAQAAGSADLSATGLHHKVERFLRESSLLIECVLGGGVGLPVAFRMLFDSPALTAETPLLLHPLCSLTSHHLTFLVLPPPNQPGPPPITRRARRGAPDAAAASSCLETLRAELMQHIVLTAIHDRCALPSALFAPMRVGVPLRGVGEGGGSTVEPPTEEHWLWAAKQLELDDQQVTNQGGGRVI